MKLVLLSGGSGKRLWPLSNESRSKQFLKVLTGSDGRLVSMLQRMWDQLDRAGLQHDAYVCASKAQWEIISAQIGDVPFIEEPTRRDTFPAIALACTYLRDQAGLTRDEVIVVMPVDHFVEDAYFQAICRLPGALAESGADLALLGVAPTEPTSKFGYIRVRPGEAGRDWRWVAAFEEKPETARAEALIRDGALWNCGVFCFRLGYILDLLAGLGAPEGFEPMREFFHSLPKRSFDYEVVEKAASVVVCRYDGTWKDLGTWNALSEEMDQAFAGIGQAVGCENTHVVNELGIPLVAMGLRDAVVVAAPDGILVADKAMSAGLKDVVGAYDGRPMYEERRWGTLRVLDVQKLPDGTEIVVRSVEIWPGHNISYQKHLKRSEVWTITEGEGEVALDDRILPVGPGDVVRVYAEQWHAIRARTRLQFIEVQRGSELVEEDIVRRYLTWEEIRRHCGAGVRRHHSG
ncbi:sugar phosphate nucleotidyltransferase [Alicyclobacillus macrosporangiidus]|uniref:sugar phosphate nucleotidyltransferase n=1 Tax=Alicyclobacillus macrosporangiidus TaxID=392015 RepID=UPI000558B87D|nr:sugar phosphate nucleotidyltransferase [Alicyclobacillus macrosporangiidus]